MFNAIRDVLVVISALICAMAAIYVVYNVEQFKNKYSVETQFLEGGNPPR